MYRINADGVLPLDGAYTDEFLAEQPEILSPADPSIFTRTTDAWNPARIEELLRQITIGTDLTTEEREAVKNLVVEFADCFALSVSEVLPVESAAHHLNLPNRDRIPFKVHQQPLVGEKQAYFAKHVDLMLQAGIIAPIAAEDVKFCGNTVLAQKAH
ncbi:hypothetical protein BV25DRAFT_1879439, partial [Artomyces pyxidatus]